MLLLPTYLPSVTHERKVMESLLLREPSDKFFPKDSGVKGKHPNNSELYLTPGD